MDSASAIAKNRPIACPTRKRRNAFTFAAPGFALLGERVPKSRKMTIKKAKLYTQNAHPGLAIAELTSPPSRRFSLKFTDFHRFHHFCASFWTLPGGKSRRKAFILWILYASEQFSDENPWNFDARCKALPERDQKRSGRENRVILQSVTWPCSKRDFSVIFVGYSSRIFDDFQGFS